MERALAPFIQADLARKMVFLSGSRQAGKTTLAGVLAEAWPNAQILDWDVVADRRVMLDQSWSSSSVPPNGWRNWPPESPGLPAGCGSACPLQPEGFALSAPFAASAGSTAVHSVARR